MPGKRRPHVSSQMLCSQNWQWNPRLRPISDPRGSFDCGTRFLQSGRQLGSFAQSEANQLLGSRHPGHVPPLSGHGVPDPSPRSLANPIRIRRCAIIESKTVRVNVSSDAGWRKCCIHGFPLYANGATRCPSAANSDYRCRTSAQRLLSGTRLPTAKTYTGVPVCCG